MSKAKKIRVDDSLEATYLSSKFRFTIDNIPQLRESYSTGMEIASDNIKDCSRFMNADVHVQFNPYGIPIPNVELNYCCLFLLITLKKHMKGCFYVKYSCGIVDENKNDLRGVHKDCINVSHDSTLGFGLLNLVELVDGDKITESLTVEVNIEIFTERTYLRWLKLYPQKKKHISSDVMYQTTINFVNQDYDDTNNKASIGVKVDDEVTKLFSVSKKVVCGVSDVFKTRLTGEKWDKGKLIWIKNEACQLIENGLTIENGIQSFIRADLSDAKELREKCLQFCMKNFQHLKVTAEWKEFKKNHTCLFIELIENVSNLST